MEPQPCFNCNYRDVQSKVLSKLCTHGNHWRCDEMSSFSIKLWAKMRIKLANWMRTKCYGIIMLVSSTSKGKVNLNCFINLYRKATTNKLLCQCKNKKNIKIHYRNDHTHHRPSTHRPMNFLHPFSNYSIYAFDDNLFF